MLVTDVFAVSLDDIDDEETFRYTTTLYTLPYTLYSTLSYTLHLTIIHSTLDYHNTLLKLHRQFAHPPEAGTYVRVSANQIIKAGHTFMGDNVHNTDNSTKTDNIPMENSGSKKNIGVIEEVEECVIPEKSSE